MCQLRGVLTGYFAPRNMSKTSTGLLPHRGHWGLLYVVWSASSRPLRFKGDSPSIGAGNQVAWVKHYERTSDNLQRSLPVLIHLQEVSPAIMVRIFSWCISL